MNIRITGKLCSPSFLVLSRNDWIFFNRKMLVLKMRWTPVSSRLSLPLWWFTSSHPPLSFSLPSGSYLDSRCEFSWLSHRLPAASFWLRCLIINGWTVWWAPSATRWHMEGSCSLRCLWSRGHWDGHTTVGCCQTDGAESGVQVGFRLYWSADSLCA